MVSGACGDKFGCGNRPRTPLFRPTAAGRSEQSAGFSRPASKQPRSYGLAAGGGVAAFIAHGAQPLSYAATLLYGARMKVARTYSLYKDPRIRSLQGSGDGGIPS